MDKKLGIVVPYRNRFEHLVEFKDSIISYLENNGYSNYEVIIVEQDDAKLFNRGMLLNIGFIEAKNLKCNYVVFHDVDMLPVDVDYSYSDTPLHLATDDIPFESYFGGITLFPSELFEKINGFSNLYWGWGFEDDDLRYRCIKNNIPFQNVIADTFTNEILPIFNGVDAYAKIPNIINYNRDFKIELDINMDRVTYKVDSQSDTFPILTISGYDFKLFYNSFNRFYLQLFDKKGNYYDVHSDIVTTSKNKILIEYNKKENTITFAVNDIENVIELSNYIYNYSNTNDIIIGTDDAKENFFKGTINEFLLKQNDEIKIHYKNYDINEYKFTDISDNEIDGEFFNVYLDYFKPFVNHYSYIPFRRSSKLLKLKHKDCGFNNGRWQDDNSRWNQLRYNNEVQLGHHDDIDDGLSTCIDYTIYSKIKDNKITYLNVGI
jgi:hypothetical protein